MRLLLLLSIILSSITGWGQSEGDYLFDSDSIHTVDIEFSQPDWWGIMAANKDTSDTTGPTLYIPATVIIDGTILDSTGVRFKGYSSFIMNPTDVKRSFKLDFNRYIPTQQYDGLKKINLNCGVFDPTMIREKLYLDILRNHNLAAPRCTYTKLYINGAYWGLYYMIEQIDKGFLQDRFGNKDGNLYKGDNNLGGGCARLSYESDLTDYYPCYELKTNKTANDWTDLQYLTYVVTETTPSGFKDSLDMILNVNSFLAAWAAGIIMINHDVYWADWPSNYYIYHNSATQLFDWISWDVSSSFGGPFSINDTSFFTNLNLDYIWPQIYRHPLSVNMIDVPEYRQILFDYVCQITQNDFNPNNLFPIIDSLADRIRPHIYADTNKYFSNTQFEENLNDTDIPYWWSDRIVMGLKKFINRRYASISLQMMSMPMFSNGCLYLGNDDHLSEESNQYRIYPNPAEENVTIEFLDNYSEQSQTTFVLYDLLGKQSGEIISLSNKKNIIDLDDVEAGIYIYVVSDKQGIRETGKLIVK